MFGSNRLFPFLDVEEMKCQEIKTSKCGIIKVYVQGELDKEQKSKAVFMTVHDLGSNHKSILRFTKHPSMVNIASRLNKDN